MSVGKRDHPSRFQTLLVFLILNGTGKTKLAKLAFKYCGEIMENSNALSDSLHSENLGKTLFFLFDL